MADVAKLVSTSQKDYGAIDALAHGDEEASGKQQPVKLLKGGNSVLVTAGVIVGDTIGAGLLTMSSAVSMFGWLLGSVFIVAMLALNIHICIVLWRLRMEFPHCHTLGELAEATFSCAPRWQQTFIRKLTDQVQYLFIFFMLAADCTSYGKGLGLVFYDVHLCLPIWVLVGSAVLLPIHARTRSLGENNALILFNAVAVLSCVAISMHHFFSEGTSLSRSLGSKYVAVEPLTLMGILNGLNIMTFNFTIQFMVVEIVSEMESPQKFPAAIWGYAYPFLAVLFLACGVGGYYFLGDHSHGLLISNLPFGMTLRFTAACLVIFVLVAYLLKSIVLCKALQSYCDKTYGDSSSARSEAVYMAAILLVLTGAFLTAQIVPFFTPLIDLIGATLAPLCCIAIPLVMYGQWCRTLGSRRALGAAEKTLIAVELLLSILIMTLGTYDSVLTIVAGWKKLGSPFACHCEHLWNTCHCSSHNPGIHEQCKRVPADLGAISTPSSPIELPGLKSFRHGMWWY